MKKKLFFSSLAVVSAFVFNVSVGAQNIDPGANVGDLGLVTFTYQGNTVTYTTVRLGDGSIWLQQNLGSSQVATSSSDRASWGHYFQWGRWDDGHQVAIPNEANNGWATGTSSNNNGMPSPNNPTGFNSSSFYHSTANQFWITPAEATVTGTTLLDVSESNGCDPCRAIGAGWTLPAKEDWEAVKANTNGILGEFASGISNTTIAFESVLKIPTTGLRVNTNGGRAQLGTSFFWSSTADASNPAQGRTWNFNVGASSSAVSSMYRGYGISVRCVNKSDVTTTNNIQLSKLLVSYTNDKKIVVDNMSDSDLGTELSVYDVQGKLLLSKVIDNIPRMVLDVNLERGVYLVSFSGQRNFTAKIVK